MSIVTAKLYDTDNLTYIRDLPYSKNRTATETYNQMGAGGIDVPLLTTDVIADMTRNRYVRFFLDGVAIWSGRIREQRQQSVVSEEEAGQIRSFALYDPLHELKQSVLLPAFGTEEFPTQSNRAFGWMSPEGKIRASTWGAAVNQQPLFQADTPLAAPYIFAWRVHAHATTITADGTCYYRYDFHLDTAMTVAFYVSSADNPDVYVNGVGVMSGDAAPGSSNDRTFCCIANLPAGDNCIAVRNHNIQSTHAWITVSAYKCVTDASGVVTWDYSASNQGFLFTTGFKPFSADLYDWRSQLYPTNPIGVTVGMVIRVLLEEAQARGRLLDWTLNFDDDVDTRGTAWDNVSEIQLPVGASLVDCLIKLASVYCDFSSNVVGKVLNAWRWREKGTFLGLDGGGSTPVYWSHLFGSSGAGLPTILELVHQEHADA